MTASMRISPGPSGPGATIRVGGPVATSLRRSETRPAHASGVPAAS